MSGAAAGVPVIRLATKDDVVHIRCCAEKAYAPYVAKMEKKPAPMVADFAALVDRQDVFVLEVGGTFCGYIVCYGAGDHFHIENIAVLPELTGRGYGRKLVRFAEIEAQVQGFSRLELYTNEKMRENLVLYPRLGYEEFARQRQDGFARVFFRKQL